MDPVLTDLGERILTEDCEEAFREISLEDLRSFAKKVGLINSGMRLYKGLHIMGSYFGAERITHLSALVVYESLGINDSIIWDDHFNRLPPRNFDRCSLKLLEAYLAHEGLIKEEGCEFYHQSKPTSISPPIFLLTQTAPD
jgi:hypothetical protein